MKKSSLDEILFTLFQNRSAISIPRSVSVFRNTHPGSTTQMKTDSYGEGLIPIVYQTGSAMD